MAKRTDPLHVQVAFKIRAPKDAKISKKVFEELLQRIIDDKPLPKNVEIRGIFWRNPARRKPLNLWRWHDGADLRIAPKPIESFSRGSLQDAIETLLLDRLPIDNISFSESH